jgi:hypothetical protein
MPIAQKHPGAVSMPVNVARRDARPTRLARFVGLGAGSCLIVLAGCSHGSRPRSANEPPLTGTALWLKDPCASDSSIDDFGWTRYSLRDIDMRVPREYKQFSRKWDPDVLSFRRGSSTLTLSLTQQFWATIEYNIRRQPRFRMCYGEIAGYVANVATYTSGLDYVYVVYWDHRWEINGVGKWVEGVVRANNAEDANRLRQALLTVRLPVER